MEYLFSNRDLRRLIWPLVIEQLLSIILGMADIVMVAYLGEAAVSGVSLVDSMNILFVQVFAALGTGGAVVAAQYIGHGDGGMASRTARQLLYTITLAALVVMAFCLAFHKKLLALIFGSIDADVMDNAVRYFLVTIFALPAIAVYNGCAALFRAQGNSRVSMLASLLINIVNIGGNAALIFGCGLGVEGAAVSTLVSRLIAAVVLFVLLYSGGRGKTGVISVRGIARLEFDGRLVRRILRIGIPNGFENSMFQIGKILVLSLISSYGTAAIAANAAANTLASFEILPGSAVGLAMLTVAGQCMGAGKTDQAGYYTGRLMKIAYASMIALNIPLLLLAEKLIGLYHLSPEASELAWYMTMIHGVCGMFIWPLSFTLPNTLRAADDAAFTMAVSVVSMWTVRIGVSWVFKWTDILGLRELLGWPEAFGATGVWFAMVLDWAVRSVCFTVRFRHGRWKSRRLI